MRLCIDATPLLLRSAGIKNYLYYWLGALRELRNSDELFAFPAIGKLPPLTHEASILSRPATIPRIALAIGSRNFGTMLNWSVRGASVFHASNIVRQRPKRAKLTATIHDMTCWLMPQFHTAANVRADQDFADAVLKQADGLIAVSEHSRQDAIRILNLKPERIRAIHSGVADRFFSVTPEETAKAKAKYGLTQPYLLSLGTVEPRKNLDATLAAYQQLPKDIREGCQLAIAGPIGWASQETVGRLSASTPGVRYLGYLPESDLPGITAGATAFVYPSLYEGFGFPVAQAMAAGVPVVTSNVSCLPEVLGDGGLLVDPQSPAELSAAFARVITSPSLQSQFAKAGRERAERYRWEICAQQSWAFFREIAGE